MYFLPNLSAVETKFKDWFAPLLYTRYCEEATKGVKKSRIADWDDTEKFRYSCLYLTELRRLNALDRAWRHAHEVVLSECELLEHDNEKRWGAEETEYMVSLAIQYVERFRLALRD